jgi:hypothetical protein
MVFYYPSFFTFILCLFFSSNEFYLSYPNLFGTKVLFQNSLIHRKLECLSFSPVTQGSRFCVVDLCADTCNLFPNNPPFDLTKGVVWFYF